MTRRRTLRRAAPYALVLTVAVAVLTALWGVLWTAVILAVVTPPSVAYGRWTWRRPHRIVNTSKETDPR